MKRILYKFIGKLRYQKYFQKLYRLGVEGMNYGVGPDFGHSGEEFALKYIKSKIVEPVIIFDVGANVGEYSLLLSKYFTGKIYSFEPSIKVFEILKTRNANSFNIGFSNEETTKILYSNKDSGLSSVYKRNLLHFNTALDNEESISLTTIDKFCCENHIKKIDFLKLDIEGHELFALKGASKTNIRFIQFEFGGCNIDSRTYFQDFWYLLKDRYRFYRILKDGLQPINDYSETLEIFTTVNYLLESF